MALICVAARAAALLLCLAVIPARAVCLDPVTQASGYRVPLRQELASSEWVVVARIVSREDIEARDPRGPDTSVYQLELVRSLKGKPPRRLQFVSPNDSGGYRAQAGETHLLFLHSRPAAFVDACGNSSELPAGEATLAATRRLLGSK